MGDIRYGQVPGWDAPGDTHAVVTPSDSTVVAFRALYVGTGGNVALADIANTVVTWKNVPGGSIVPMRCTKVMATNTTASDIVGIT